MTSTGATPSGREQRVLMPSTSPRPALRRPTVAGEGRYASNRHEREYATLTEQLDALAHDIHTARKVARHLEHAPRRMHRSAPPLEPRGELVRLADGARILVRPIEPADAPQLKAGFERLDAVSRYRRFLTPVEHLSRSQLDYLTRVDHHSHEALVAVDAASGDGVGVARFVRDAHHPRRADVAVVVAAPWRRRGVATALTDHLAARAQAVGIESFTARMLIGNHVGRRLVERAGDGIRERQVGGTVVLTARPRSARIREEALPATVPEPRRTPRWQALARLARLGRPQFAHR